MHAMALSMDTIECLGTRLHAFQYPLALVISLGLTNTCIQRRTARTSMLVYLGRRVFSLDFASEIHKIKT